MPTVKLRCESLLKSVLPPDASETQRSEMRNAFYAGYLSCFNFTCYEVTALSDEAAEIKLCEIEKECHDLLGISMRVDPHSGN